MAQGHRANHRQAERMPTMGKTGAAAKPNMRPPMMPGVVMPPKAHPGFKAVQSSIAQREGISQDRAGAILASAARKASPAARARNPRLNRVKGRP